MARRCFADAASLQMILDVEPEDDEEDEEEEEEEEDENESGEDRMRPNGERRHHRVASDLSVIESSAEMLYGLIHQRFICSRAGIQQMSEKYELGHFGVCPRTNCNLARTLPVGLSDIPLRRHGQAVSAARPVWMCTYRLIAASRPSTVPFFGRTFGALFLLTFPEYDLTKHGAEVLSASNSMLQASSSRLSLDDNAMVNGMYARNIAPGLGRAKTYEPKILRLQGVRAISLRPPGCSGCATSPTT